MSTKTTRKRVALATVVALGAGVLSLITVSSASATVTANSLVPTTVINGGNPNKVAGAASNPSAVAGVLNIAQVPSITGAAVSGAAGSGATSQGLVAINDLAGGLTATTFAAGTTQTATLLTTGGISVYTGNTYSSLITVTGGTIASVAGSSAVAADGMSAGFTGGGTAPGVVVKPTTGVASMTIRLYSTNGYSTGSTPWTATEMLTGAATGVLTGQIVVTIASSSTSGVVSAAKSSIYYAPNGNVAQALIADNTAAFATNYTNASVPWSVTNFASINVKDAYGVAISSTTGLLTATATNGALVALAGTGAAASGSQSTAFMTGYAPDGAALAVAAPSAAPLTTVVTIAFNGVTLGTKTFVFSGPITKVTLGASNKIMRLNHSASSGDSYKGAIITYADAAGNTINPVSGDAAYPTSGFATTTSSDRGTVVMGYVPTSTVTGYIDWSCGAAASTDNAIVSYTNVDGSVATSNAVKVSCANDAATYTASYDKSTYTPGSLATLSVKFLDSKGNLATDYPTSGNANSYFSSWSSTNNIVSASGGVLAANPSITTATTNGVATFTVLLGVSDGTYQSTVNTGAVNGITQTTPAIASLSVTSGSTSLNDVLKGIVSLIASINKQIAALAKLVTKKK